MTYAIVVGILLALSAGLLWRHVRVWKSIKSSHLGERDIAFFRRQFRRRLRTTCIMAAVAICLGIAPFITHKVAALVFWIGVTLLVFLLSFSAFLDLLSTRSYLQQARQHQFKERAKLEAEIRRLRTPDRNGDE